ncbi:MAG TPA: outer membrane protein assembly factor BamE [Janthinobacterium sp.]|nr:outer membrane protein assembly factor BamE [Janthinobacterium sp.]
MRVAQAVSPSFLRRFHFRTPAAAGLVCAALVLSGCASRSALGEKPAEAKDSSNTVVPAQGAQTTEVTRLQKFLWIFSPYRPTIQQGNFISQEMLAQLKPGMTRDQVKFILGTPLLADVFHDDEWDYPFRLAKGNGEITTSRVVVFFKDNKVDRFEGGNLPTEKEYIAKIAGPAPLKESTAPAPAAPVTQNPLPAGTSDPAAAPTPAPVVTATPDAAAPAPAPAPAPSPTPPAPPAPQPAK